MASPTDRPGPAPAPEFFSPVVRTRRTAAATLTELRQPERRRFPRHGHERPYVSLLFAGSYVERWGSRALEHRPPSLVYHPPDLEHQDEVGPAGGRFLVVDLEPAWLERAVVGGPAGGGPRRLESDLALRAAWRLRQSLTEAAGPCGLAVEGLVLELVGGLDHEGGARERGRPRWLDRTIERLRSEYTGPVSLARLAAEAGVHPAHLWRVFRRAEGCSPSAYVQRLRCRHVFRRLADAAGRPASLADLALEAGFADQSHCTRVVKRLVGVPPGALRRDLAE